MEERKVKNKWDIVIEILNSIVILALIFVILFPIVWMLPAMFKPRTEIFDIPVHFLPQKFTWNNLTKVFTYDQINFGASIGVTFCVAILGVILSLIVNMMAAYSFARLEYRGKKILWAYMIFSMFVPGITILITSLKVVNFLNITDTFLVLVLPGVVGSYNIFFFYQFFLSMPISLEEAAMLDGCSRFRIFVTIFIPLSTTPMVIIGINVFMGYWNNYMWPALTIASNTNLNQIMQNIVVLNARFPGEYGIVICSSVISMIIPMIIYACLQRYIVQGIMISGLK